MDIALASIAMHQGKAQQQASILMMKKTLDHVQQQGEAIEQLLDSAQVMERAVLPHKGTAVDLRI